VDVHERLAQIRSSVENARAMPMGSAVVNRSELLAQIDALAGELAQTLAEAERLTADREATVAEARTEAERIVARGRDERDRLVSETEVYRVAKTEADRVRDEAVRESDELRRETDEYVDRRLANFEVTLAHTLEAVARGRERLHGRGNLSTWGDDEQREGRRSGGPVVADAAAERPGENDFRWPGEDPT
jgi:F0F1-type ATP synthase membrane subunit b/b'